jgi:hypothetical protein
MQKPKIESIWLDLDGVCCDFEKRYKELYHIDPKEAEKKNKFGPLFQQFIETNQFATLDMMEGTIKGIDFLRRLPIPTQILSSTARPEHHEAISKQKYIWLQTHGITFNPIFVPGAHLKAQYATPNRILIDDTLKNIQEWRKAGGIGIHHKTWDITISLLKIYCLTSYK